MRDGRADLPDGLENVAAPPPAELEKLADGAPPLTDPKVGAGSTDPKIGAGSADPNVGLGTMDPKGGVGSFDPNVVPPDPPKRFEDVAPP